MQITDNSSCKRECLFSTALCIESHACFHRCPKTCGICPADSTTTGETCNNLLIRLPPFLSDPTTNSRYGRAWERVLAKAASEYNVEGVSLIRPILGRDDSLDSLFHPHYEATVYTALTLTLTLCSHSHCRTRRLLLTLTLTLNCSNPNPNPKHRSQQGPICRSGWNR